MHLSCRQLSSSTVVSSVQSGCRINNHECESVFSHKGSSLEQKFVLLVSIVSSSVSNIVKYLLLIKTESFGDWNESLWSESTFTINVHGHSFSAPFADWQLTGNTKSMANLSLSSSELTEQLCYASSLNSSTQ